MLALGFPINSTDDRIEILARGTTIRAFLAEATTALLSVVREAACPVRAKANDRCIPSSLASRTPEGQ